MDDDTTRTRSRKLLVNNWRVTRDPLGSVTPSTSAPARYVPSDTTFYVTVQSRVGVPRGHLRPVPPEDLCDWDRSGLAAVVTTSGSSPPSHSGSSRWTHTQSLQPVVPSRRTSTLYSVQRVPGPITQFLEFERERLPPVSP